MSDVVSFTRGRKWKRPGQLMLSPEPVQHHVFHIVLTKLPQGPPILNRVEKQTPPLDATVVKNGRMMKCWCSYLWKRQPAAVD